MKHPLLAAILVTLATAAFSAQETITVVDTTDLSARRNEFYAGNREPLLPSPLIKLPAGSIQPAGWLRRQLELEADGFVGHLTEISSYCNKKDNAWLSREGKGANGWEEVPYWLRGFSALSFALGDSRLVAETREWLEPIIESQREDGYFGPRSNLKERGDHDMMPNMFIMFALRSFYEYTNDPRVLPLLTKYFKWQMEIPDAKFFSGGWQVPRNGDNLDSVYWLYNRTGDAFLLDLADKLRRTGASWMKEPTAGHNVDYSQGFRKPGQFYPQGKDRKYLEQAEKNFDSMYNIYGQVPGGLFCGDEFARPGFTDPRNAIETCGIAEMMLSEEILLRVSGDLKWADRCENAAFNSLPAALTADMKALRYLTSPNQIASDRRNRGPEVANSGEMFAMNPHSHRCCQHNMGMAWPYFSENLWQATPGNGLAAVFYAASQVKATVGSGEKVTIQETTPYPFDGQVELALDMAQPVRFPLYLRVPAWCAKPQVSINGKPLTFSGRAQSFIRIEREWKQGDRLQLILPMEVRVQRWEQNKNSASVARGPLTFSVKIGEKYEKAGGTEKWPAWDILPTTAWNYGLVYNASNAAASFEVVKKPWPASNSVFTHEGTPVEIRAHARKVPTWEDTGMGMPGKLQPSPVKSAEPEEQITMIPMGAGRLRISALPVIGTGPDAVEWHPTEPMPASYWPRPEAPMLLRDGRLPAEGGRGVDCFKWVGWAGYATGQKHWVRQDFEREETIQRCEIFWSGPAGFLDEPMDWKLYYLAGKDWKPVTAQYAYAPNQFTRLEFQPVKTRALKIEAQMKPRKAAGIYEWRSWANDGDQVRHSCYQNFGVDIRGEPAVKTVSGSEVRWHLDSDNPQSRVPRKWKLFARQNGQWREVQNPSSYGLDPAQVNRVTFEPVAATAMRLDVYADPEASAGTRDWKIISR